MSVLSTCLGSNSSTFVLSVLRLFPQVVAEPLYRTISISLISGTNQWNKTHGFHFFWQTNFRHFSSIFFHFSSIFSVLFYTFNKCKHLTKYSLFKKSEKKYINWLKFPDFSSTGKCTPISQVFQSIGEPWDILCHVYFCGIFHVCVPISQQTLHKCPKKAENVKFTQFYRLK